MHMITTHIDRSTLKKLLQMKKQIVGVKKQVHGRKNKRVNVKKN